MSRQSNLINGLVSTLEAVTLGRVFESCGETHTSTHDLTGRVTVGTDPGEGSGLRVSVHHGATTGDRERASTLSGVLMSHTLHVFGLAPTQVDTPKGRAEAAYDLQADIMAGIFEDAAKGLRFGSDRSVDITFQIAAMDGDAEFEGDGATYIELQCSWSSNLGV